MKLNLLYIIGFILTGRMLLYGSSFFLYYGVIFILLFLLYLIPDKLHLQERNILVFIVFLSFGLLLNRIPVFLKPYEKFLSFFLIILTFSPLFRSSTMDYYRRKLFYIICNFFVLYSLVSFLGLLLGILPLQGYGGFQGITIHAMTLSAISAISALYFLKKFIENSKLIYLLGLVVSFIVVLLGASRAALLAFLIGSFIYLSRIYRMKMGTLLTVFIFLISLVILFQFLPNNYTSRLNHKFAVDSEVGSFSGSRNELWEARLQEFSDSPIYGIGFGHLKKEYHELGVNEETGGIESGTSWGMVLSMSGLLGFFAFCFIIRRSILNILQSPRNTENSFILAILVFLLVHMFFEGYIFSSGNILMIYFWLTLSMTFISFSSNFRD